jgi:hypothetical protein
VGIHHRWAVTSDGFSRASVGVLAAHCASCTLSRQGLWRGVGVHSCGNARGHAVELLQRELAVPRTAVMLLVTGASTAHHDWQ